MVEIKVLKNLIQHDKNDEHHIVRMYDYFVYKKHLIIVFEVLMDSIYDLLNKNRF